MPGAAKRKTPRKLNREDDDITLQSLKQELKPKNKGNGNVSLKRKIVRKAIEQKTKTCKKKPSLSSVKDKLATISTKKRGNTDDRDANPPKLKRRRRRRRKQSKNNAELDEASRLQRRTRYLLIKMKLEQNLIDAYSTEGWKGQSREKIKPERELQRAKTQILKYKLGIREAIHQLDLLSSEGHINNSAVALDGSVHHEHIICAKCKLREAFPDNDIILCDGTCNCAFHQKCIDPPLSTENIPPGDEGWFCKFCKKKMEILEATNAHLGTHFAVDSNWQDVFKEEAALPDGGNYLSCQGEEWPSDDSADDDYDPDRIEYSCSNSMSGSESNASDYSSSSLGSLEDEDCRIEERSSKSFDNSHELIGVDSDENNNVEIVSHPRQRASVDYIKLYNEMFGKSATENEQISDDEDWGPTKRKRKGKETDAASTLMNLGKTDKTESEETPSELREKQLIKKIKRPIFRLPHNAVEKLRLAFAENELPERAVRVRLSKQLGLEFEKVNKWFKNARYLALKARKQVYDHIEREPEDILPPVLSNLDYTKSIKRLNAEMDADNNNSIAERADVSQDVSPSLQKESISETAKDGHPDQKASRNNMTTSSPKSSNKFRRRNTHLTTNSFKIKHRTKLLLQTADSNQMTMDLGDDVSLKQLREKAKKAKKKNNKSRGEELKAETEMERLCQIKSRLERLQQVLLELPRQRLGKAKETNSTELPVIFVPIAELREKR